MPWRPAAPPTSNQFSEIRGKTPYVLFFNEMRAPAHCHSSDSNVCTSLVSVAHFVPRLQQMFFSVSQGRLSGRMLA